MVDTMRRWCYVVEEFDDESLLFFDLLYLSKEGRAHLGTNNVCHLCSIKKGNFPGLVEALKQSKEGLEKGDFWAGTNLDCKEVAVHHNSLVKRLGHK